MYKNTKSRLLYVFVILFTVQLIFSNCNQEAAKNEKKNIEYSDYLFLPRKSDRVQDLLLQLPKDFKVKETLGFKYYKYDGIELNFGPSDSLLAIWFSQPDTNKLILPFDLSFSQNRLEVEDMIGKAEKYKPYIDNKYRALYYSKNLTIVYNTDDQNSKIDNIGVVKMDTTKLFWQ